MAVPATRGGAARLELRVEVEAPSPLRLPRSGGLDGLMRSDGGVLHRLLHRHDRPVHLRAAQLGPARVLIGARAACQEDARWAIERMRMALGLDQDIRPFLRRFWTDPLIGAAVRADPRLRVRARPEPFEALAWAICEQLIEYERAAAIQRRLAAALGRRCPDTGLRDAPSAQRLAGEAPARLESLGLSASRAIALVRVAREVASGRVDLYASDHERGWARLLAVRTIGPWTVEKLALEGQGRLDKIPAGDLAYIKLVGRLLSGGDPWARASEEQVREFFAPYHPWAGLAGIYALRGTAMGLAAAA